MMSGLAPGPVRRVPIFQIMLHDRPFVCTDQELGEVYTRPVQPAHVWSVLGSLWAAKYQLDMEPIYRWTKPVAGAVPDPDLHLATSPAVHCRLGALDEPGWADFARETEPLGWCLPVGSRSDQHDLIDVHEWRLSNLPSDGGFFYDNRIPHYLGTSMLTPEPITKIGPKLRLHAPQVGRVGFDITSQQITMDPDPVIVSRGGGAPIWFLRSDGLYVDYDHMTWSFADLVLEETSRGPSGSTYASSADFKIRHLAGDGIIVIDDVELADGQPERDTNYRLTIQVHDALHDGRKGVLLSRDPKVRNGTSAGSGAVPPTSGG